MGLAPALAGGRPRTLSTARALANRPARHSVAEGTGPNPVLSAPNKTLIPTVNVAPVVGWPSGAAAPTPAPGMRMTAFARDLAHPRWLLVLPNGDVLVAESAAPPKPKGSGGGFKAWVTGLFMKRAGAAVPSANRISLLRDADGDGVAEFRSVLLSGLHSPFGMALVGERLFVANADAVLGFPYRTGDTTIGAPGTPLVALPAGINHHWTKGLIASPDYLTSVRDGGFYGWPYSYHGQHVDARVQPPQPALVATAIAPDYALGPHTASLGLASSRGSALPAPFVGEGMFIGQHGSWNRQPHSGYKVIFVPFQAGRPAGMPVDVLTGFLNADGKAQGRPVGVAIDRRGGLLVADDAGNVVWRVSNER